MNKKKKKLKLDIYLAIRNDIDLRKKLSKALNIESDSVYKAAFRKSNKFSMPFIVEILKNHLAKSESEILELND